LGARTEERGGRGGHTHSGLLRSRFCFIFDAQSSFWRTRTYTCYPYFVRSTLKSISTKVRESEEKNRLTSSFSRRISTHNKRQRFIPKNRHSADGLIPPCQYPASLSKPSLFARIPHRGSAACNCNADDPIRRSLKWCSPPVCAGDRLRV
jgi:hypothetical protein